MKIYFAVFLITTIGHVESATPKSILNNPLRKPLINSDDDQLMLIRFLIKNRKLCGRLFADVQWSPVIYKCDVICKDNEVCVENDDLQQGCSKLPSLCASAWLKRRGRRPRSALRSDWVRVRSKMGPRQRTMLIRN